MCVNYGVVFLSPCFYLRSSFDEATRHDMSIDELLMLIKMEKSTFSHIVERSITPTYSICGRGGGVGRLAVAAVQQTFDQLISSCDDDTFSNKSGEEFVHHSSTVSFSDHLLSVSLSEFQSGLVLLFCSVRVLFWQILEVAWIETIIIGRRAHCNFDKMLLLLMIF